MSINISNNLDYPDNTLGVSATAICQKCGKKVEYKGAFVEEECFTLMLPNGWDSNCYKCKSNIILLCNKCIITCKYCTIPVCDDHMKIPCEKNHDINDSK